MQSLNVFSYPAKYKSNGTLLNVKCPQFRRVNIYAALRNSHQTGKNIRTNVNCLKTTKMLDLSYVMWV